MYKRVAILIQRGGPTADRQADVCSPYCLEHHYAICSIVPPHAAEQAVQLVRDRLVDTIVVAFEGNGLSDLVTKIAEAGGQTIAVHPQPRVLAPPPRRIAPARWVTQMVARWHRQGMGARQIAALLEDNTADIQAILLRIGFDPTRK